MSVSMLSEQLVNAGVTVEVFATTANGQKELPVTPGVVVEVDGVKVIYFKRITKDHTHFSPMLLKKVWKEASRFDAVHIHAWWNLASLLACMLALMRKVPVIVSPRGTLSTYSFNNKNIGIKQLIHRFIGKPMLNRCFIHVTSERERDAISTLIHPKSITVLPNFVRLLPYKPSAEIQKEPELKLIFFSRIEQKKGLDLLIEALAKVNVPYQLTIAGDGDKDYVEHLKTIADDNNVGDKINWIGFQNENKFALLQKSDLFVLPSYDENFGNAVIESLSVGTPVLISEQVGLVGYVLENKLGWICKTNADSIAEAINEIVSGDKTALQKIRDVAPGIIHIDFNEKKMVTKYIAMYNQITAK